jgi:predicted extracellular nuclease
LVDASGNLIEFLSYEGSFVAVGGPADGIASIDIGVAESNSTPIGYSLQKPSGIWSGPAPASPAQVNEAASSGGTAGITLIHQIQADGFLSPLIGESVTIEAIVVGAVEGMGVTIPDRLYVTEYFNLDRFGEIRLASAMVLAMPQVRTRAGFLHPVQPS